MVFQPQNAQPQNFSGQPQNKKFFALRAAHFVLGLIKFYDTPLIMHCVDVYLRLPNFNLCYYWTSWFKTHYSNCIHKNYHYLLMMIYSGHCCDNFSIASVEMRVEGASKYHWCYDNIKNGVAVARKNTSRWFLHRPPILFFSLSAHHPPHVPI